MTHADGSRLVDVAIVGGGIVGCAVAYALARDGQRVRLFERDAIASQASGAAAGMIAPFAEAHLSDDASGGALRMGRDALRAMPALCEDVRERTGIDPEWEPSGILRVAFDADAAAQLEFESRGASNRAASFEWLDAEAARSLEPKLAPSVAGALWSPHEGHVRSPQLARAYLAAAEALGARVSAGNPVLAVEHRGERVLGVRVREGLVAAGAVVVCTGAWAGGPGAGLSLPLPALPVEPVRGQILALRSPPGRQHATSATWRGARPIVWGPGAYLVPKRDGSLVVGATEERVGFDRSVTAAGVAQLLAAAPRLLPSLASAELLRTWAGLRPGSPDGLPAIGAVPGCEGAFVAAGHHRNGVLLSWTTALAIAQLVGGKGLPADARACRIERWL